jgi:hypothetical protein
MRQRVAHYVSSGDQNAPLAVDSLQGEMFGSDYKLNLEIELELEPRSELWKSFATSSDYFSGSDYILSD